MKWVLSEVDPTGKYSQSPEIVKMCFAKAQILFEKLGSDKFTKERDEEIGITVKKYNSLLHNFYMSIAQYLLFCGPSLETRTGGLLFDSSTDESSVKTELKELWEPITLVLVGEEGLTEEQLRAIKLRIQLMAPRVLTKSRLPGEGMDGTTDEEEIERYDVRMKLISKDADTVADPDADADAEPVAEPTKDKSEIQARLEEIAREKGELEEQLPESGVMLEKQLPESGVMLDDEGSAAVEQMRESAEYTEIQAKVVELDREKEEILRMPEYRCGESDRGENLIRMIHVGNAIEQYKGKLDKEMSELLDKVCDSGALDIAGTMPGLDKIFEKKGGGKTKKKTKQNKTKQKKTKQRKTKMRKYKRSTKRKIKRQSGGSVLIAKRAVPTDPATEQQTRRYSGWGWKFFISLALILVQVFFVIMNIAFIMAMGGGVVMAVVFAVAEGCLGISILNAGMWHWHQTGLMEHGVNDESCDNCVNGYEKDTELVQCLKDTRRSDGVYDCADDYGRNKLAALTDRVSESVLSGSLLDDEDDEDDEDDDPDTGR